MSEQLDARGKELAVCDSCRAAMVDLFEQRIRRILAVGRELGYAEPGDDDAYEDIGQSHCFHLTELIRILKRETTCGVFDDYGPPATVKGPLFDDPASR